MKTLLSLLKINLFNTFNINKILKNKKNTFFYILLFIFLGIYLGGLSAYYAWSFANALNKFGMISFMLIIFFIFTTFTTFIFTIYSAKSGLFNSNDNDMLLSMPISSNTILASRLLSLIISNLLTSLLLMAPALIVYALKVDVTFSYYIFAVLVFLMIPVIPTILACIVGYVIAYFTSKSNSKNWIELVLSFIFIIGVMLISSFGNKLITYISTDTKTIETILKWGFYPIYLISKVFSNNSYLSLILFLIINLALTFIFVILISKNFKNIIAKLQENKTKSNYVIKTLKTESVRKSLFIKDLKRYFSSPIYVLNTIFGVLFLFIMSITSIFYDKSKILAMLDINQQGATSFMILNLIVVFVIFMSNTASVSISIEGKNFWIVKSLPIEQKKVLESKLLLNLFITLPIVLLSIIILKFTFEISIIQMFLLFLMAILSSLVAYQFGLLVNLKFPRMDAINDTMLVKRSLSTMISMMVPMILIFTVAGIYGELNSIISFNLFILIIMIIFAILIILERIMLNTWGIKRFNEIN